MTKDQAIRAIHNGQKLTHVYFSDDEWVSVEGDKYIFEDGCMCDPLEFWRIRSDNTWQQGWETF